MTTEKKTVAKAVEKKVTADVKTPAPKEEKPVARKSAAKAAIKKKVETILPAAPAKKKETKPVAKKTVASKKSTKVMVQFFGMEVNVGELESRIVEQYVAQTGLKKTSVKNVEIYVKPEEKKAYYVIDGETGHVEL